MSSPDVQTQNVNFRKQLEQTLAGYQNTAGGFFDLSKKFAPLYTDLNLNTLARTMFGSQNAPGTLQTGAAANTFSRANDIADIAELGPAGYAALLRSNPALARSLKLEQDQAGKIFAPGGLMSIMQGQAKEGLLSGGKLSGQELANANQDARATFASRGLSPSNQSMVGEILNRDALMRQRENEARQYAGSVEGLAGQGRNFIDTTARTAAAIYDPSQQVLGRSGTTLGGIGSGGGVNPGSLMGTLNTSSLFNPLGGADAYFTNVNQRGAANIANANNSAAQQNSWWSIAAAALLSDERLKTDKKRVGKTKSGIPLYRFKYKDGSKQEYVGPMAQDVEKVHPGAVHTMPLTGHKLVDLRKTDAPFVKLKEIARSPQRTQSKSESLVGLSALGARKLPSLMEGMEKLAA